MAIGYSVKLPLQLSPADGPFALNKTLLSVVRQNIKMIIFTSPGERIMDSNFGVGIRSYLFEQNTEIAKINLRDRIIQQIRTYLPFVTIVNVAVTSNEQAENAIYVKLEYTFSSSNLQVLDFVIT